VNSFTVGNGILKLCWLVACVKKTSAFGDHACVGVWNFGELMDEASGWCFCENGDELSVSVGMGSFLVQLSGLTVTEEGFIMKNSDHSFLTHSSKLHQIITYIF